MGTGTGRGLTRLDGGIGHSGQQCSEDDQHVKPASTGAHQWGVGREVCPLPDTANIKKTSTLEMDGNRAPDVKQVSRQETGNSLFECSNELYHWFLQGVDGSRGLITTNTLNNLS